jgi:nucleotide-binding universal stress UspA family protein
METMARRIVVGVDGSEASHEALRWAVRLAALTGAAVVVIHAWQLLVSDGWSPMLGTADTMIKAGEELVTEAVAAAGASRGVTVHTRVVEGHPATVLLNAARNADLLVVGSRGHGAFVGALLGSTSLYCVQHAACPVVVVRAAKP